MKYTSKIQPFSFKELQRLRNYPCTQKIILHIANNELYVRALLKDYIPIPQDGTTTTVYEDAKIGYITKNYILISFTGWFLDILTGNPKKVVGHIANIHDLDLCLFVEDYKKFYILLRERTSINKLRYLFWVTKRKSRPLVFQIIYEVCCKWQTTLELSQELKTTIPPKTEIPNHFREFDLPRLPIEIWAKIAEYDPKIYSLLCKTKPDFWEYARNNKPHFMRLFSTLKGGLYKQSGRKITFSTTPDGKINGNIISTLNGDLCYMASVFDGNLNGPYYDNMGNVYIINCSEIISTDNKQALKTNKFQKTEETYIINTEKETLIYDKNNGKLLHVLKKEQEKLPLYADLFIHKDFETTENGLKLREKESPMVPRAPTVKVIRRRPAAR